jgi:chromosomal replication initiator protein
MQAWESYLGTLQAQLGDETIAKWLRPLKVVHFDACNLYLEAQDSFQIDWFEQHIRPKAKKEFVNKNARPIKIHLTSAELEPAVLEKKETIAAPSPSSSFTLIESSLFNHMTIDQFIFGTSNQMLRSLIDAISDPAKAKENVFNPLFFHGAPSSGKTHLLQALTHLFRKNGLKALYVKTETFTDNVVNAIRSGNMLDFRKAHRQIDALIFDDVHLLAKKTATQEEFFHTFNALHSQGKQIILSAHELPSFLEGIEPRLISRFEWGLVFPIQKLEKSDLLKMLQKRCEHLCFPLPEATLKFLIGTFSSSLQSLQRSLEALALRAQKIPSKSLSSFIAADLLKDLMAQEQLQILSPEKILFKVADFFDIPSEEILGRSQTQEYTAARQLAMFLCRTQLKMPFTKIGEYFKRDHSTVISSVRLIEEKMKNQEKDVLSALFQIKQKLGQTS